MGSVASITLDSSLYREPTQEEFETAKQFVLDRTAAAAALEARVDALLRDAARDVVMECFRYTIDARTFTLQSDSTMYGNIVVIMDGLRAEVLSAIEDYCVGADGGGDERSDTLAYVLSLGRGGSGLEALLDEYLWRYLYDLEAMVASAKLAGMKSAAAVTLILSNLHGVYSTGVVRGAIRDGGMSALRLRPGGVRRGRAAVGQSSSGATNVTNMGKITVQMAWNRRQGKSFEKGGAVGYYQMRGSSYPCDSCDAEVGLHLGFGGIYERPEVHPHCCCIRIPVYAKDGQGLAG